MGSANVEQLITDHIDLWTSAIENKSSSGRGSSKKQNLFGIKKLRELILELAVRGKLVPQDPNDEPAVVLLERIAAERDSLIRAKAIKKPRRLPEITEEESLENLPSGWARCRLGSVMNVLNGRAYKKHEMLQEGTPLLRVGNLFTSKEWYYSDLELEPEKYIDTGDLIYAWSASFGPFIWDGGKAIYHYHIWKLDFVNEESLYKPFIFNFLLAITEEIKASGNGIAMVHMTKDRMEKLILRIPPYSEQIRISEKVAELMALCDQLEEQTENNIEAHKILVDILLGTLTQSQNADELTENWERVAEHFDTLFTTEHSIDQLKQTILQLAVMGKLVPQDPNDEPASILLERIFSKKELLIKDKKIKKQKTLPPIEEAEISFELPENWEWVRLQNITSKVTDGDHKTPKRIGAGMRMLSAKNVRDGYVDFADVDYISENDFDKSRERCLPEEGDLMIVSVGGTIGRSALVPTDSNFSLVRSVALVKPLGINSDFLKLAADAPLLQNSIHSNKRGGAQPCLYLSEISKFPFPLPPLKEQERIADKVGCLLSLCNQLQTRIQDAHQTQLHISDSLCDQAVMDKSSVI